MTEDADAMNDDVVLSRLDELMLDEALFGAGAADRVTLDRETEVFAGPRFDLQLLTAALSRPARLETIPEALRARVQASAFAHFEAQGAPPKATATTTGANIVELSEARPVRARRSRASLMIAIAACFAFMAMFAVRSSMPSTPAHATRPSLSFFNPARELAATAAPHAGALRWSAPNELELVIASEPLRRDPAMLGEVKVWLLVEDASGSTAWTRGPQLVLAGEVLSCSLADPWHVRGWALTMSNQDGPADAFLAAGPRE